MRGAFQAVAQKANDARLRLGSRHRLTQIFIDLVEEAGR